MSAVSPGSRLAGKQTSEIQIRSLEDESTSAALATLHTLVRTSFGPNGKLKVLHNNSGGHATITSCSARLFGSLSVSKPVVRLLTTAVQAHINTYSEGGLFTAFFALNLIQNSLVLSLPRRLLMEAHEFFLRQCIDYLNGPGCGCKHMLDLGNLDHLKVLVRSILSPKVGCGLCPEDIEHLTGLIVRAFLKTFQGSSDSTQHAIEGTVSHVGLEGRPASESTLSDGVLFSAPHIPTYRKRQPQIPRLPDGTIHVAVFTISLAGDSEDLLGNTYELSADQSTHTVPDLQTTVLAILEELVGGLEAAGVGVVCCQKVVHPAIKQLLRSRGLLVVDRLGSPHIGPVLTLTGATPLSSFLSCPPEGAYGVLEEVRHVVLGGRSYLHLVRGGTALCTLLLCQRTESALDELKHVSTVSQAVLRRALHLPAVLSGGGCWQTHLAAVLRTLLVQNEEQWSQRLSCTPCQLSQAGHAFCLALDQVAMATSSFEDHVMDLTNQHHWTISHGLFSGEDWSKQELQCSCGQNESKCSSPKQFQYLGRDNANSSTQECAASDLKKPSPMLKELEVVDLFEVSINGLKTAVAIANMALGIQHYIHDTN